MLSIPTTSRPSVSRRARRGLTYAELTIGMAITAVLMLALSTFAVAVSKGWAHSNEEFKTRGSSARGVTQMQDALADMLCLVQVNAGNNTGGAAYAFCWKADTFGGTADKKAQLGEMALIEYDPTTKAVWLYEVKATLTTAERAAAGDDDWGEYTDPAVVTYFKASSFVAPRRPIVGGYYTANGKGLQVMSAQFGAFAATNGKPIASYRLMIGDENAASPAYGNVALRAAQIPTNLD